MSEGVVSATVTAMRPEYGAAVALKPPFSAMTCVLFTNTIGWVNFASAAVHAASSTPGTIAISDELGSIGTVLLHPSPAMLAIASPWSASTGAPCPVTVQEPDR